MIKLNNRKRLTVQVKTFTRLPDKKPVPTIEENNLAAQRLIELDAIQDACAWDKFEGQCSNEELEARDRWNQIMQVQSEYEEKYKL